MDTPWFLYTLIDPRTGCVRYVGKTTNCARRLRDHISRARSHVQYPRHSGYWLRQLLALDIKPTLLVLETGVGDSWPKREKWWVAHYREVGVSLTNHIDGGTSGKPGHAVSEEARARISAANKGRKRTDETRHRMSVAHQGLKQTPEHVEKRTSQLRGRKMPREAVERIASALRGRKASPETRKKLSDAQKARGPRVFSEQAKANIAKSNRDRVWTDEVRQRVSAANTGRIPSEETRAKLSASRRGKKRGPYKKKNHHEDES